MEQLQLQAATSASYGGGLLNYGMATLTNCTVSGNSAVGGNGGGIINYGPGAILNLDHVVVANNSAYADASGNFGSGGGIENDGSLTVTNSTFKNDLASGGEHAAPITGPITEVAPAGGYHRRVQGPSSR